MHRSRHPTACGTPRATWPSSAPSSDAWPSCSDRLRRRWSRGTRPWAAATHCCASSSAPPSRCPLRRASTPPCRELHWARPPKRAARRRGLACRPWTCGSIRHNRASAHRCARRLARRWIEASRLWCSSTAAATHPCWHATPAGGFPPVRIAARTRPFTGPRAARARRCAVTTAAGGSRCRAPARPAATRI